MVASRNRNVTQSIWQGSAGRVRASAFRSEATLNTRQMFSAGRKQNAFTGAAILVFGMLGLVGQALGQDVTTTLTLNLNGAVATALKQNIDVQISTLNIAAKQQERNIARSDLLPHASLEASETIEKFNLKAMFGLQLPNVPKSIGPFQSIRAGPSFQMPVFDLTLLDKYKASGHKLEASRQDSQAVREQMTLLTVSEYSAHLRATADVAAAQSRVALAARLLNQAQDLLKDGVATKVDVSRADVRLSEEKQKLIDAQSEEQTTGYALKRILDIPDETRLAFSDDQEFFNTPELTVDDSVGSALTHRPEVLSLQATVKSAEAERKAAVSKTLPTLTANGHWDEEASTLSQMVPGYEYRMDFKVPIFTGGRLKAERDEARVEEKKIQAQLVDARNRVVEQTHDGKVELEAALEEVNVAKKQVGLAIEELDLARGRFEAGVTDNIEVIAGQDAVAHANDAQIAALYRYAVARAQLARAIGASEQVYTQP